MDKRYDMLGWMHKNLLTNLPDLLAGNRGRLKPGAVLVEHDTSPNNQSFPKPSENHNIASNTHELVFFTKIDFILFFLSYWRFAVHLMSNLFGVYVF